jgi:UDP-GlcNAc3NAcA epimerase
MTCHRDANTSDASNLEAILSAVSQYDGQVIFPMHPRTKAAILKFGLGKLISNNMIIIEPLGFWETQSLLKYSRLAITDSGGIIKEAYFHKVPGIIIDRQTEWIETLDEGWNVVTGPVENIIKEQLINHKGGSTHTNALGDGMCGERITNTIISFLNQ